ncbi:hypothetical protein FRC04_002044 [Tulasnella sp. 424]|nr:hypothetical protein FRC04_002044 [Tulasnella sp. 424]KAG8968250.1 hypothetical protein FRC05_001631 [Tulasnella sp. 425]
MASLTAVARRASSQLRRPQILAPSAWATGSTTQRRSFRSNDLPTFKSLQDEFELEDIEEFEGDDATGLGHLILRQQREYLNLFRKIELEVPQLKDKYLTHRQLWYGGEEHPAEKKAVIVVPVSKLPLTQPSAVHKFKLIAGTRWSREYPKDSGFSSHELESLGEQGFIKISCEDMPDHGLNLKWCSDVLDRMVKESNDPTDTFSDVPIDDRHIRSRDRKQRTGKLHARRAKRPTIDDFPKEWLPDGEPQATPRTI